MAKVINDEKVFRALGTRKWKTAKEVSKETGVWIKTTTSCLSALSKDGLIEHEVILKPSGYRMGRDEYKYRQVQGVEYKKPALRPTGLQIAADKRAERERKASGGNGKVRHRRTRTVAPPQEPSYTLSQLQQIATRIGSLDEAVVAYREVLTAIEHLGVVLGGIADEVPQVEVVDT